MLRLNRWIAATLAACLLMNTIPVYAFEETDESISTVETTSEITQTTQISQETQQETPVQETESQDETPQETDETVPQEADEEITPLNIEEEGIELAAEGDIPEVGDTFADSFIGVLNNHNISTTITKGGDGVITLTIGQGQGEILALLSQQTQTAESNYQKWNIKFPIAGDLSLPDTFQGLGDCDIPFLGTFSGEEITIISSNTIFKSLGAGADLNNVKISWQGSAGQPILAQTLVADSNPYAIKMPLISASNFSPYIGILTGGSGLVTLPDLVYTAAGEDQDDYSGDAGLVCGRMEKETKLQVGNVTITKNKLVLSGTGSVGSLVGSMEEDTTLTINKGLTLISTLNGVNVGGLVGSMTKATITVAEEETVTVNATLTATEAAGGIAGVVTTEVDPIDTTANVVLQSVKANGTENSGVLYGTCTVTGELNPLTSVSFSENAVREVSGEGNCGGLFGTLVLNGNGKCTLTYATINTSLTFAVNTTAYGGVAGKLEGVRANALIVNNSSITSKINVGNETANYPKYLGGIVAKQVTATLDAGDSTVQVYSPKTATATDCGFGGVTAYLDDNALLIADGMEIFTDSYSANPGGGGVVGSAHKGSIVYLKNSLDLSECQLSTNATSGQIVGSQECSLIYAPSVDITRLETGGYSGMELDDIGNYGELYRLEGFLTVNESTYNTTLPVISYTNNKCILSSPEDYACLALAWQSRGYFLTVDEITNSNWFDLKKSTIQLDKDIVMTGYGIGGLSRDVYDSENPDIDAFTGVFVGGEHTLTLDIGAENQANTIKVSKGDGRIYWHNATGLFAAIFSSATVKNLTLAGSIRISNNKLNAITPMYCGGLAASLSCDSANTSLIDNVNTEVKIFADNVGKFPLYIGGLFGQIYGKETVTLNLRKLAAEITLNNSDNGNYNHIGGAVGFIDKDANVTIVCDVTTLAGKIEYMKDGYNIYAGGLVGTIFPGGSGKRNILITNLTVNGFSLTGSASERMGGILGGIWANTDVTVDGLTVSNATLTANGAAALGGLVYRASGKWTVSSANLSGLTITASNASALGVLICQGGPYKDTINGSYQSIDGLYLEMTNYWDWNVEDQIGYNVPSIITFGGGIFDEFVAYTAYADRSSDRPNYQITVNGSGIISLKTDDASVHMNQEERNTYVNRTTVGKGIQDNLFSRYYYNLPDVLEKCKEPDSAGDEGIDTASELLIWSVYRYAASNLKTYFEISNVTTAIIGGTFARSKAQFDMIGLSYYPINITNEDVTVQYADIKFYNDKIETKELGNEEVFQNKLTRGTSTSHSQHYTMHCGLFLNYTADKITSSVNRKMTVNGVNFAGTVGVVNGGSGALLCGMVAGETREGNTSICTVVLADADEEGKAVSLNGLSVAPAGDYTPVLINTIGFYAGLKANYVTTTDQQTEIAGSSLIGNVGEQGATGVSIAFAGTIKLPETGVFSKATLLNSLRYNSGSATYNFYKSKDYIGNTYVHNVTHGKELSTTVEYAGKQGCYYDGYGAGYYVSTNSNFDSQNDFDEILPYVALSPATGDTTHTLAEGWHEIAVNILSDDITDGCGTYGHPYKVNGNLLKQVANYINNGTASDGWRVKISADDNYHATEEEQDVLLTYSEGSWKVGETLYTDEYVRKHLQSAYYVITEDIELANFSGIGTSGWAFTGVIKGSKKTDGSVPTVTLSSGSTAFIQYSYGSVVRDLNIVLNQSPTLTRPAWKRGDAEQTPITFFGGVIGCVLGGDNIIDNVTVEKETKFNNINLTGTNTHLVPVGGYVGVIAGGGVIFRGDYESVNTTGTGITGTDTPLYRNPIIGRVLGGYAFYEGDGVAPENGDKNYTINKITPPTSGYKDLSWDGTTLTVNNAQGLLILSAIVSSGAGSISSNAYTMGKARNATYGQIGAESQLDDYEIAQKDAGAVWGDTKQTPYLLSKYAGYTGNVSICNAGISGIDVKFMETTFNMDDYDNGYRGLSARYVSNAAFVKKDSKNIVDASTVVMRVQTFDGQNADVQNINMVVKEYQDDDFHMASMGGIFNIVWTEKQSGGGGDGSNFAQNLTLTDCNVSLMYVDSNDKEQNEANIDTFSNEDGRRAVSVGGFIGMANDIDASTITQTTVKHNYLFTNIHIEGTKDVQKCKIYGPNAAGGLIGTTAMTSTSVSGYPGKLLANGKWALLGPSFLNCSYSDIDVTGGLAAGGLIGDAYANTSTTVPNFSILGLAYSNGSFNSYASCTVTDETLIVGQNAKITANAKASVAGGLFGAAGMRVGVNDPEVNQKFFNNTTDSVVDTGNIRTLRLLDVEIKVSQVGYNADGSNPDSGENNAYAAGIIGRIGNVNPSCFYDINISGGSVTSKLATSSYVGGVQGSGYTNSAILVQRCQMTSFNISGINAGGLLGSGKTATGFSLSVSECKLENCKINGSTNAGGLVGDAASKYYLSNLLFKNTSIMGKNAGRLFGTMTFNDAGDNFILQGAGISVFADDSEITVPESIYGVRNKAFDYRGYIAYADYAGTETEVAGEQAPYVTVNPNFTLTENKMLTGDAVGIDDSAAQTNKVTSIASRIWTDQNKTDLTQRLNRVSYQNVTAIAAKTEPEISTFQTIQACGPDDLPVLVLKGGDSGVIENYLDVITNGGYSKAKNANADLVEMNVSVYYYQGDKFALADEKTLATKKEPASVYIDKNTKELRVRSSSYDNTRKRFSLVEVNFKVDGKVRYTVSVPVVVIRKLQLNFMSTFSYGREFNEEAFSVLKTHLLESTGNPFTAYLTYQYNCKELEEVAYDWQSYMDDGGSMLNVDKVLNFSSGLPKGTQMILMDCQNGNQAYQYIVNTASQKEIKLGDFTSVCSPSQTFQSSMAEILGVTCTENPSDGNYVETEKSSATIRWKDESGKIFYYRALNSGESTTEKRYDLKVPDFENNPPRENYYLVITVPYQYEDFALNGNLKSELDWSMPSEVTCVHRHNQLIIDAEGKKVGEDDETSYQISSGYRQKLVSTVQPDKAINLGDTDNKMQVKVEDTITFSNKQIYGDNDKLYLKLTVNLQEYTNSGSESEEKQFPVGTTGKVNFYVNDGIKYYYYWDGENKTWKSTTSRTVAVSYDWASNGGNMELLLSDGTNALDLSYVRQMIKGNNDNGDSQIIVTAEMDIEFGSAEVLNVAVPGSEYNGTDTWVQLHYLGQISTQDTSLSYSAMRATAKDKAKYYRGVQYQAVLSMDAIQIDQLGVNPLQLVEDYQENINGKNASRIDLTAALNLANLQNIESVLKKTDNITFTLSLQRKNDGYIAKVSDASNYIAFDKGTFDDKKNSWSWTIPKDQYYNNGAIVTNDIFDGTQFTFPITAYVFNNQKGYANYKIKLGVSFGVDSTVSVTDSDAYVVYTYACIKPSFYELQSGGTTP